MGKGFDLTGSYNVPLAAFLVATLLAAVLMTRLGPYRFSPTQPDENDQMVSVRVDN